MSTASSTERLSKHGIAQAVADKNLCSDTPLPTRNNCDELTRSQSCLQVDDSTNSRAPLNSRLQRVLARHRTDSETCVSLAYQVKALRAREKKRAAEHSRDLSKAQIERNSAQTLCEALRNDKRALETSLQTMNCQRSELADEHRIACGRATAAEARVEQLMKSLNAAEAKAASLRKNVEAASKTQEAASHQSDTSSEVSLRESSLAAELQVLKTAGKQLEDRVKQKDEKYCRMEAELRKYIAQLKKVSDDRHTDLVNQYEEKISKMKQIYDEKVTSWQQQVTELTAALTSTSTRYSELELRTAKSETDRDLFKTREASAHAELSIMRRERQTMCAFSRQEISRYSSVVQRLKELYVVKEGEYDKLLAEKSAIEIDLEAFEKLLETEDARLDAHRRRKRRKTTDSNISIRVPSSTSTPLSTPLNASQLNFSFEMTPCASRTQSNHVSFGGAISKEIARDRSNVSTGVSSD